MARFAAPENGFSEVAAHALATPLPTPPLWFWITHVGMLSWGSSDFAVRLPSAFAGILGVAAIYKVGAYLFRDRRVGLTAALLLALSPGALHYAREARYYAIVPLLGLVSTYLLYRALRERGGDRRVKTPAWSWGAFGLVTLLNLYVHLTAFFVLAGQCALVCGFWAYEALSARAKVRSPRGSLWRPPYLPFLACLLVLALLYVPMLPHLWQGARGERGLGSDEMIIAPTSLTPGYALDMLAFFGVGYGLPLTLYAGTAIWALVNTWRKHASVWFFFALMVGVPYAFIFVTRPKHWFAFKYVITLLPLYLLAVAVGVRQLARPLVKISPLGVNVVLAGLALGYGALSIPEVGGAYEVNRGAQLWQTLAQVLRANLTAEDTAAYLPTSILTMSAGEITAHYDHPAALHFTTVETVADAESLLADHRRVWFVEHPNLDADRARPVMDWLAIQETVCFRLLGSAKLYYVGAGADLPSLLAEAEALPYLNANMLASIADAYADLGLRAQAVANLERAIILDPFEGWWFYRLALYYDEWGQFAEAQDAYRQAIALAPQEAQYHGALGAFYARHGRPEAAVRAYRKAIDLYMDANPSGGESYYVAIWHNAIRVLDDEFLNE
jgi:tetratricopeptide (TPR) repeat protein